MDKVKMGQFLAKLRNDKSLRQQDEADIFQVSPQAISKWESGESVPDIGTLEKLSNFYKVGIDEIINGEVKNPNQSVSTVVVAKNPTMEDRGIGKPYYGAFIFCMSALLLALILSFLPFLNIYVPKQWQQLHLREF
jgi:transcriptional regulator with XRE-family HTH domain